jgi:hypothetical protein
MIGLILFVVWVVSVIGAVSYYARETMEPTISRVIIAFSPIVNTLFCLRKRLFSNVFNDIVKEFK